nr:MAG TPA: TORSO protein [Caudoviricetes sp.]
MRKWQYRFRQLPENFYPRFCTFHKVLNLLKIVMLEKVGKLREFKDNFIG